MARNRRTPGIILTSRRFGEYHKSLMILSPEEGLFRATAYGAVKGKSRLAGVTEPFTEGEMYLYHDPVKDRIKLSEVDPTDTHDGLRGELRRFYIASFWVEIVIKSFAGGGEFAALYTLLKAAFSTLERTEHYDAVTIHFIWRYLELIGFRPDISSLAGNEGPASDEPNEEARLSEGIEGGIRLNSWGREFLHRSAHRSFAELARFLESEGESAEVETRRLKLSILRLVQEVVESPLNTLSQGLV